MFVALILDYFKRKLMANGASQRNWRTDVLYLTAYWISLTETTQRNQRKNYIEFPGRKTETSRTFHPYVLFCLYFWVTGSAVLNSVDPNLLNFSTFEAVFWGKLLFLISLVCKQSNGSFCLKFIQWVLRMNFGILRTRRRLRNKRASNPSTETSKLTESWIFTFFAHEWNSLLLLPI